MSVRAAGTAEEPPRYGPANVPPGDFAVVVRAGEHPRVGADGALEPGRIVRTVNIHPCR